MIVKYLTRQNPLMLAAGVVLAVGALYWFSRKAVKDAAAGVTAVGTAAASTIAGVATGNNPITQATPYEGTGIFGTLGAAANATLAGVPQRIGESLGSMAYRIFHGDE